MLNFGLSIIALISIVAGLIAWLGDNIGRKVGRQRVSLFGLRPRYTAIAITIATGILIAFSTIVFILTISQDARTALFGLEQLKSELEAKTKLLEKTKDELSLRVKEKEKIDQKLKQAKLETKQLEKTKQQLKKQITTAQSSQLLFGIDDVISISLIQAGPERNKLAKGLKQILSTADQYIRRLGSTGPEHLIYVSTQEFEQTLSNLKQEQGQYIVKVVTNKNTLFDQQVNVRFELVKNDLIYQKGQVIGQARLSPVNKSTQQIEAEIQGFLARLNLSAQSAGIIPDPSGSIGSLAYSQIFELSQKAKKHGQGIILQAIAQKDIYAIGPLEIYFRIFKQ